MFREGKASEHRRTSGLKRQRRGRGKHPGFTLLYSNAKVVSPV